MKINRNTYFRIIKEEIEDHISGTDIDSKIKKNIFDIYQLGHPDMDMKNYISEGELNEIMRQIQVGITSFLPHASEFHEKRQKIVLWFTEQILKFGRDSHDKMNSYLHNRVNPADLRKNLRSFYQYNGHMEERNLSKISLEELPDIVATGMKTLHHRKGDYAGAPQNKVLENLKGYVHEPGNPWYYFHMTDIKGNISDMLNPSSKYSTPIGIYSYPLSQRIYEQLVNGTIPFRGTAKYIVVFKPSDSYQNNIFHIGQDKVSRQVLSNLYIKFKEKFSKTKEIGHEQEGIWRNLLDRFHMEKGEALYIFPNDEEAQEEFIKLDRFLQKKNSKTLASFSPDEAVNLIDFLTQKVKEYIKYLSSHNLGFYADSFKVMLDYLSRLKKAFPITSENEVKEYYNQITSGGLDHFGLGNVDMETMKKTLDEGIVELWSVVREISGDKPSEWSKILYDLGYLGFHDHDMGIIHENEPEQAVFFTPRYLETVDIIENPSHSADRY